jgi:hypothetical protein
VSSVLLDPHLQDGKKIPKWHPRARRGMFLGFSSQHSTNVGLVLNLKTGHISPQYHLVFDDLFSTVSTSILRDEKIRNDSVFQPDIWNDLISTGHERNEFLEELDNTPHQLPVLDDDWLTPTEIDTRQSQREHRHTDTRETNRMMSPSPASVVPENITTLETPARLQHSPQNADTRTNDVWNTPVSEDNSLRDDPEPVPAHTPTVLRRGSRARSQNPKCFNKDKWVNYQTGSIVSPKQKVPSSLFNAMFLQTLNWQTKWTDIKSNDLLCFLGQVDCNVDFEEWNPMALQMRANAADNPSWEEAMNGPDQSGYWKAMESKLKTLEHNKDSWDVVDKEDFMNVLPSTWAFKCKRFPDGTVCKLKARFCVQGS